MVERDISAENQAITLGDEFMKAMLENIRKNTETVKETNAQIKELGVIVEGMKTMKDNVDGLGKGLESVKEVLTTVKTAVERPAVSSEQAEKLRADLRRFTAFFEQPLKKDIHHKHFLGWPAVVLSLMGCLVIACVVITVDEYERAGLYRAGDIKFRALKLVKDSILLREVFAAERQCEDNPDQFRKDVIAEEERREALTERLLELSVKESEIEQLEREEKHKK